MSFNPSISPGWAGKINESRDRSFLGMQSVGYGGLDIPEILNEEHGEVVAAIDEAKKAAKKHNINNVLRAHHFSDETQIKVY